MTTACFTLAAAATQQSAQMLSGVQMRMRRCERGRAGGRGDSGPEGRACTCACNACWKSLHAWMHGRRTGQRAHPRPHGWVLHTYAAALVHRPQKHALFWRLSVPHARTRHVCRPAPRRSNASHGVYLWLPVLLRLHVHPSGLRLPACCRRGRALCGLSMHAFGRCAGTQSA